MLLRKLLIIDDDVHWLRAHSEYLKMKGYEVETAESPAEGLRMLASHQIDLVLLDIYLGSVDGFEVLNEIRQRNIPTRVVMFTAYPLELKNIIKLIKAGACDYVEKADGLDVIAAAIERALVLDTTINMNVSNAAPLIGKLSDEAENLKNQLNTKSAALVSLEKKEDVLLRKLRRKDTWSSALIRITYLAIATGITVLFFSLKILTTTQSLVSLPLLILLLMLFPIERVKSFSAKYREIEASAEIDRKADES